MVKATRTGVIAIAALVAATGCGGVDGESQPSTPPIPEPKPLLSQPNKTAPAVPPAQQATLVVTCEGATTAVSAESAEPRDDGIHITTRNLTESELAITVDAQPGFRSGVEVAPPGEHAQVWTTYGPGTLSLACYDPGTDETDLSPAVIQITDPRNVYGDDRCKATGGVSIDSLDGSGVTGSPLDVALAFLKEDAIWLPGDILRPAGYTASTSSRARVIVVREGHTAILVDLDAERGDPDSWKVTEVTFCE